MEPSTILIAFGLTLFAGLATGIGGFLAFFTKHTDRKFLSIALGFSAGVMLYVSFMDILPIARESLVAEHGLVAGSWITFIALFAGILIVALIDRLVPNYDNPHVIHKVEEIKEIEEEKKCKRLMRIGILTAIAIAVHNFPEGIATFVAGMQNIKIGIPIAIAIALHNIPEGIAVSIPIYHATCNRMKSFYYSILSGLAEPLGALVGFIVFRNFLNNSVLGMLLAAVAGIMIFISLDELLPAAREFGEPHSSMIGLIAGMGVMAISLLLFL